MFLELIFKEFKKQRNFSKDKRKTFFLTLLKLIFVGAFIALEVFIFLNLDKKIEKYSSYGTYDFLVLFIFVLEIVAIVSNSLPFFKSPKFIFLSVLSSFSISSKIVLQYAFCVYKSTK